MAFYFTLSCLRSYVLLRCNCMYVYLATNTRNHFNYCPTSICKKIIQLVSIHTYLKYHFLDLYYQFTKNSNHPIYSCKY